MKRNSQITDGHGRQDLVEYFAGKKLYGDDFSFDRIQRWHADEKDAYSRLLDSNAGPYRYVYHELNKKHGFAHIGGREFDRVLGIGSAHGDEFLPIIQMIKSITIVESSDSFARDRIFGVPCQYLSPTVDGSIPCARGTFDLITCLGVLHHIPNVSDMVREFNRCLKKHGLALLREPIVSMGDWTKPRPGLTKRERGIPLPIFCDIIQDAGFDILHQRFCQFPFVSKLCNRAGIAPFNSAAITTLDALLCRLFSWNINYHARKLVQKYRPESVYLVIQKRDEVPS